MFACGCYKTSMNGIVFQSYSQDVFARDEFGHESMTFDNVEDECSLRYWTMILPTSVIQHNMKWMDIVLQ